MKQHQISCHLQLFVSTSILMFWPGNYHVLTTQYLVIHDYSVLEEVKEVLGDRTVVTAEDLDKLVYMEQVQQCSSTCILLLSLGFLRNFAS